MMLTTSAIGSGPPDSLCRSDSPSTNGMVKYGSPLLSPAESTGTMLAWLSEAASWISRSKRSIESPCASSGDTTLITTLRRSRVSSATYTRDIPPPPSSRSMVYWPDREARSWER